MLIQSIRPRRATKRPIIILCAIVGIVLFGGHFETPFASVEGDLVYTTSNRTGGAPVPRIQPLFQDIFDSERLRDDCTQHRSGARRSQDALALDIQHHQQKSEEALEEHYYRKDGLLQVNPEGPHPIFELVRKAQEDWDRKLRAASATLEEAVDEYRRRYNRLPPKGFDHWYARSFIF
jgi:hypothetical protein